MYVKMILGIHSEMIGFLFMIIVVMVTVTSSVSSELCNTSPEEALYTTGKGCLRDNELRFVDMFMLSSWEKLCTGTNTLQDCLRSQFQTCSKQYIQDVIVAAMTHIYEYMNTWIPSVDSLIQMINRRCEGSSVRDSFVYAYQQAKQFDCVNDETRSDVNNCVQVLLEETADVRLSGNTSYMTSPNRQQSIIRFGMSTFQCVRNLVRANCNHWAQDLLLDLVNETIPQQLRMTFVKDKIDIPLTKMSILSTVRATVGAYGGVHLVVHDLIAPITCSVSGHMIYLSNQLFIINGYNHAADKDGQTYIDKLEIAFFRTGGGFTEPKIQINSTELGYVIMIRKSPEGYMFSIRISDDVLRTSSGILISGCSFCKGQVINVTAGSISEDDKHCHDICEDVQITDEDVTLDLRKACIFDCIKNAGSDSSKIFLSDVIEARDYDDALVLFDPPTIAPSQESSSGSLHGILPESTRIIVIMACYKLFGN
ncbi:hypothetical protein LSH36_11g05030 [Paralvinella palmiformis]|uniref:Uncharacterized protein n=1 Tax=Paralvinella palmiformis TaxID=53620 RepID=A0AAD9KDI6_9ANNE|nr:hypothetical protein LSH36_11g05030 [Paralvinella palmiformis]